MKSKKTGDVDDRIIYNFFCFRNSLFMRDVLLFEKDESKERKAENNSS